MIHGGGKYSGRKFLEDESAWADFLISKAALIAASAVLFAALFHLAADFRDIEGREQLDTLARDFKAAVDKAGATGFPGEPSTVSYHFDRYDAFQFSPFEREIKAYVSGEYFRLETEIDGREVRAVKPFAFRVLPFNETVFREKLLGHFGADGSADDPIPASYSEIKGYFSVLGTEESELNIAKDVSISKEFVYVMEEEGVSDFGCILIYQ